MGAADILQKPFFFFFFINADTWPRFTHVPGSVAQPPPRSPTLLRAVWNDYIVLGDNRQCVALRRFAHFASLKKISP